MTWATDPLEQYLTGVDDAAAETLRELDAAVRAAAPELDMAIKYRMPTYTVEGRWRHWVTALSATKDAVNLRFLWGVLLDDPLRRPPAGHVDADDLGLPARCRRRRGRRRRLRPRRPRQARPLPRPRQGDQRRRARAQYGTADDDQVT